MKIVEHTMHEHTYGNCDKGVLWNNKKTKRITRHANARSYRFHHAHFRVARCPRVYTWLFSYSMFMTLNLYHYYCHHMCINTSIIVMLMSIIPYDYFAVSPVTSRSRIIFHQMGWAKRSASSAVLQIACASTVLLQYIAEVYQYGAREWRAAHFWIIFWKHVCLYA